MVVSNLTLETSLREVLTDLCEQYRHQAQTYRETSGGTLPGRIAVTLYLSAAQCRTLVTFVNRLTEEHV